MIMTKALLAFLFILLLILPQIRGRFLGWGISNRFRGLDISKCIVCQSTKSSSEKLKSDESTRWFVESHSSAETDYPEGGELIGTIERVLFFLALILKAPIVIGFWLAFKTASKWAEWQHIVQVDKEGNIPPTLRRELGNYLFTRFIVGTGVNLILAMMFGGIYLLFS
ncbi:MAG: hypothetical protein OEU36_18730 [Gammaproteobacteria bacterium]|nr:hypothetical protein [Gammaproteobacteria bacterium]